MSDDETFENAAAGASETYPKQCSALRKGGHVVIKGKPCKIVETSTSKTGKHGHAKVHLVGLDIFTGKKYEDICPSTHNMEVPNVLRKEFEVSDIDEEGYITCMEDDGSLREDLRILDDKMKGECKNYVDKGDACVVTVWKAMGCEQVLELKPAKEGK